MLFLYRYFICNYTYSYFPRPYLHVSVNDPVQFEIFIVVTERVNKLLGDLLAKTSEVLGSLFHI